MFNKEYWRIVGRSYGNATLWLLRKPNTYLVAAAIGLGAGLADKKVSTGIQSGTMAALGMVGFTAIQGCMPIEIDKAIEEGRINIGE